VGTKDFYGEDPDGYVVCFGGRPAVDWARAGCAARAFLQLDCERNPMRWNAIREVIGGMNLFAVRLALRDRDLARWYVSRCLQMYDEAAGRGLQPRDPVGYIVDSGWADLSACGHVQLPVRPGGEGGSTRLDEWFHLASVTRALQPRRVFEIGTFTGYTTVAFILNSAKDAEIISLDLPPNASVPASQKANYIDTDVDFIQNRKLGSYVRDLGLESRYQQLHCDSMEFDPRPYLASVELAFIDGAHSLAYVRNDTEKVAQMMAARGLVFWHDYGGKGRFGPLTDYLESLSQSIALYRVPGTTLAWTSAAELSQLGR